MVLLGAGVTIMSRGAIGAAAGLLCVVVGIVWKLWATRWASRKMAAQEAAKTSLAHAPDDDGEQRVDEAPPEA